MIARVVTYAIIGLLALFVLATTFLLDGGGSSRATPEEEAKVSVHDLSLNPDRYRGETVTSEGTLGFSQENKQYQLVEESVAVVVIGYELEALQALDGQPVSVTGKFDFDPGTGIFIDADTVRVLD